MKKNKPRMIFSKDADGLYTISFGDQTCSCTHVVGQKYQPSTRREWDVLCSEASRLLTAKENQVLLAPCWREWFPQQTNSDPLLLSAPQDYIIPLHAFIHLIHKPYKAVHLTCKQCNPLRCVLEKISSPKKRYMHKREYPRILLPRALRKTQLYTLFII